MKYIPYGRQWIDEEDIQAVVEVLRSDAITQGPKIQEFEKALADYCGAKYAVAVNSGTSALHIACLAAGIGIGDEVVTSPITFVASANCVLYCGGRPVLADIDPETINIDPIQIKKKTTSRTKALIPVHFAGLPCDMGMIYKIAKERDLTVIEDACHAPGAEWQDSDEIWHKVGSCSHSDMAVFSFHPVKHITTGEGGAVLTNNEKFYEKLLLFRNHGITKDPENFTNKDLAFPNNPESLIHSPNPWYYEMQELGFNYRITDLQCALGISQFKKINSFVERRKEIVSLYNSKFKNISDIKSPLIKNGFISSYHLYVLRINFKRFGMTRNDLMNKLKKINIGTQVHYIPLHLQPYYKKRFDYKPGNYPFAEDYYSQALSLPLYPQMTDEDANYVVSSLKRCLGGG